ncbi:MULTISPECIES: DUF3243 domain-containing protein [Bacillales]|uniref:DUF3243 domain-containing protein n=1 Tax=Bacillales TaxID=1385 RepID=UPI001883B364|nr:MULTISPECIES: DUF3243 domain-containing protein [Bacillaceae]MBF0706878.1 DUF3243 domain-containing protein [Pseudalkalibacillus hwajinpoensis]MDO6656706.1 DUF3243 domain-containing protein [Anaerobacillus sp. 1_MG-2023]WLR58481.1 DUF3243 domain-containing protein [Pseudalkalibacillus hwajinpoensis]
MSEKNHLVDKDSQLDVNKVDDTLDRMSDDKMDDILSNFEDFKKYLATRVEIGEKLGLSEEALAQAAEKVAGYLAKKEEPKNREEKLLQELWLVGSKEQRHELAHLLVRMVLTKDK